MACVIRKLGWLVVAVLAVMVIACNQATDFGSFLEEGTALPINYHEIPLNARTIKGDSVLSWNETTRNLSHFAGTLDDPIFGKSFAEIYWQYNLAVPPDFTDAELDSIVLSVGYDTISVGYGTWEIPQDFQISRIAEQMFRADDYYSERRFAVEEVALGEALSVVPNKDTTVVAEPRNLEVVNNLYGPQLRVRLSDEFGETYIGWGDDIFDSNIAFQQEFFGVRLSPTSVSGGMINFEVFGPETRLNVYFTANDTMGQYNMALSSQSVIHSHFSNDLTGSLVESVINQGNISDSLLFVQSMAGPCVEITLADLSVLNGSTINSAIMELNVAVLSPADTTTFAPISQLALYELKSNGEREMVKDLADVALGNELTRFFGGDLAFDSGEGVFKYIMNISQHLQKVVDGEATERLILTTLRPASEASRSIIYGPSHPTYGAKLMVTHTKLLSD